MQVREEWKWGFDGAVGGAQVREEWKWGFGGDVGGTQVGKGRSFGGVVGDVGCIREGRVGFSDHG